MLTIWCNAQLPDSVMAALRKGTEGCRLIVDEQRSSNLVSGGPSPRLAEAEVAFGQPDPDQIIGLQGLKWIQITSAGYTRYDRPDLRDALVARGAYLTNSSMVFAEPCAQHLLAFMLGQARQLPQCMMDQLGERSWAHERLRAQSRLLLPEQTVLLLGFGAISRRLAEILVPFRMNVIAVRRSVRGDEPVPTYPMSELSSLIRSADHIVNALPSSPPTDKVLDRASFQHLRPGAVFYNVGRGSTVDQPALIEALRSGRLAAAYLDVTDPEPAQPEDPIWTAPNCFVTPHIAGGHAEEFPNLVRHFLRNLERYENGQSLLDRVV